MTSLSFSLGGVAVPRFLHTVSRTDHAAELPAYVAGLRQADIEQIHSAMGALYRTAVHPAISVAIRCRGQLVFKRSMGCISGNLESEQARGEPAIALQPDTPLCLFSASKAITALLVHKLVDDGKLHLDDAVADYLPEFAAHGKSSVSIRALLAHRAGIPDLPVENPSVEMLHDWDAIVAQLCAAKPIDPRFRKQSYHALTGGFIAGELVRRVGGIELRDALRRWIAEPLGLKHLTYGLDTSLHGELPRHAATGLKPFWPMTQYVKRITGVSFEEAVASSNHVNYRSAIVPSGNVCATADEVSRVFQMLLNGGTLDDRRVLKPETVADAIRPVGRAQFDGRLGIPMRFSPGFMLGEAPFGIFGPSCPQAFGHLGFVNVLCWADPARELSVALLNTGKSMSPMGLARLVGLLRAISKACPKRSR